MNPTLEPGPQARLGPEPVWQVVAMLQLGEHLEGVETVGESRLGQTDERPFLEPARAHVVISRSALGPGMEES